MKKVYIFLGIISIIQSSYPAETQRSLSEANMLLCNENKKEKRLSNSCPLDNKKNKNSLLKIFFGYDPYDIEDERNPYNPLNDSESHIYDIFDMFGDAYRKNKLDEYSMLLGINKIPHSGFRKIPSNKSVAIQQTIRLSQCSFKKIFTLK